MTLLTEIPDQQRPELLTEIPGPKSRAIQARRERAVPRGVGCALPIYIDHADGPWITDVDGNRLLDLGSGIGVTTLGHTQPTIVRAAKDQLDRFSHTLFTVTPYENDVRLAERVAQHAPGSHPKKTFFVNSGAEAVENAPLRPLVPTRDAESWQH